MPDLSTTFTDLKLKELYGHLLNHYKDCVQRGLGIGEIYTEMSLAMQYTLDSPYSMSPLAKLSREEKMKAYAAFNAIFYAFPLYRQMPVEQQQNFKPSVPQFNPKVVYKVTKYNYYDTNQTLLNWLILDSMLHSHHDHYYPRHTGSGCWGSSNRHGHDSSSNEDCVKLMVALLVIALALIAAVLAFIALAYMLNELANTIERFCFNEGWLKGALMLASSIAFGAGSSYLMINFASAPLIALAVAAGLNPVGVVIMGTVLLSIIGAGIGCFAMGMLYDSVNKSANPEPLDQTDPERFRLTAAEEDALKKKGIDPIAVKCAMVALRGEMATVLGSEKPIPSFFSRYFNKDNEKIQKLLTTLRQLRKGEVDTIDAGGLHFDCRVPTMVYMPVFYQPSYQVPYSPPSYQEATGINGVTPSAPPAYLQPTYDYPQSTSYNFT
ncbi:hypothetical protein OQJ18_02995 [Fluoribacter dumoffii]|uniref:Uncharacterized protein n=1 Tax=Fluoribacter dumoffii TaxID=463 RepID=A0A377GA53_9GAMM|nr:hypothetical protein [Fluoribacter dumoffii]KTC88806.1 hypothetical protein Ldum_3064 [Fluoribacter dumoffii NY 23]MCW8385898.1 hypothetical protein [Fluoribacter dumoffii]MCW8418952.1 hypothetical protein [Fluoribacter dumoffii]MCW8453204.1 hypothetical protein [Fluoribacter dumoffii]MCW8459575.1 hypothetical protein [Fluoribacter dumoffii]